MIVKITIKLLGLVFIVLISILRRFLNEQVLNAVQKYTYISLDIFASFTHSEHQKSSEESAKPTFANFSYLSRLAPFLTSKT